MGEDGNNSDLWVTTDSTNGSEITSDSWPRRSSSKSTTAIPAYLPMT